MSVIWFLLDYFVIIYIIHHTPYTIFMQLHNYKIAFFIKVDRMEKKGTGSESAETAGRDAGCRARK